MPATVTPLKRPRTTAEILTATAETPLHLWTDRDLLALEPVSAKSVWRDRRWMFDNPTHGAQEGHSAILWDLDLPDGSNLLDLQHMDLLDWLRRLVWSLFAAPGEGAGHLKPGTLGPIGHSIRHWAYWLVGQEIRWPHEINDAVVTRFNARRQLRWPVERQL